MALIKRICENQNCKKEFYPNKSNASKGFGKYCCKSCYEQTRKTNQYVLHDDYAELIIKSKKYGDKTLLLDLDDVEKCKLKSWSLSYDPKMNDFYFYAFVKQENGKRYSVSLHRYIMGEPKGLVIDHINTKNRLDNRKSNLRAVTQTVNCRNLNEEKFNKKVLGVYFDKTHKKWKAIINVTKNRINLGTFSTFEEAVKVRKAAELRYWGKNKDKQMDKKEIEFNPYLLIKNKTGYVGIQKRGKKYLASLDVKRRKIYIGTFTTLRKAIKARNKYIDDNKLSNRKNLYKGKMI